MMSGFVSVVVSLPRYLMIGGLTIIALAFFSPQLKAMGADIDFELILPFTINNFVPVGLMGIILAGMLAGLLIALFMPLFFLDIKTLYAYPYILLISGLGSVVEPDDKWEKGLEVIHYYNISKKKRSSL